MHVAGGAAARQRAVHLEQSLQRERVCGSGAAACVAQTCRRPAPLHGQFSRDHLSHLPAHEGERSTQCEAALRDARGASSDSPHGGGRAVLLIRPAEGQDRREISSEAKQRGAEGISVYALYAISLPDTRGPTAHDGGIGSPYGCLLPGPRGFGQEEDGGAKFTRPKKAARGGVGTREAGERYRPTPR